MDDRPVVSRMQLEAAVDAGLIEPAQRDGLLAMVLSASPAPVPVSAPVEDVAIAAKDTGDESFRLVGGGNDVFVALGIILLGSGVWSGISTLIDDLFTALIVMGVFLWALAEFITRRQRMKFSSLVIATAFTAVVIAAIAVWIESNITFIQPQNPLQGVDLKDQVQQVALVAIGITGVAALVWFLRFRVPIMTAVLAIATLALIATGIADNVADGILSWRTPVTDAGDAAALARQLLWVPLAMGLGVFAVGLLLDLKDRHRDTLLSDCAFWMHVISAPLIVHPLFVLATGTTPFLSLGSATPEAEGSATIILLALVAFFFYVALAIDRRSLLVPALGYFATVGVVTLVQATASATGAPGFAIILALIGLLVITFGAGWQKIRRLVVGFTMPAAALNRLPPIRA